MPPKIREWQAMLRKAGFDERNARGSHTWWVHSTYHNVYVTISGQDGADAKPYQQDQVANAIQSASEHAPEPRGDE